MVKKCNCDADCEIDEKITALESDMKLVKYQFGDLRNNFQILETNMAKCAESIAVSTNSIVETTAQLESQSKMFELGEARFRRIEKSISGFDDKLKLAFDAHCEQAHVPLLNEVKNIKNIVLVIMLILASSGYGEDILKLIFG